MKTLLLILLLVPMMSFGQVPSYVPTNGLIGYWPFNGNANDESGNGNNATVNGATLTLDRFGNVDESYSFDGIDDYVNTNNPFYSSNTSHTISLWFHINDTSQATQAIFNTDPHSIENFVYNFYSFEEGNFSYFLGDGLNTSSSWNVSDDGHFLTNQTWSGWKHLVIVNDNLNWKFYINGVLAESFNASGPTSDILSNIHLGRASIFGGIDFFNGKIDDVAVWNRALNQQEIIELYNSCTPTSSIDTQTACDSYTWIDGNTYTASTNNPNPTLHTINSGSYYYLPSTLTINTGDVVEWINDGGFHDVNGETNTITGLPYNNPEVFNSPSTSVVGAVIYSHTFTIPGTYEYDCSVGQHAANGMVGTITVLPPPPTFTTINAAGCDSVITLDLTINYSNTGTDVITACDSYTWLDGNTYTTSNNTATWTETNAAGCDSVVTLDLTINNSSSSTDIVTACDSYSWVDGNTYTASNNSATWTETNAAGCDSVVTLDLTINNSSSSTDIITACDSYTWLDGNNYTASNNTATYTTTNAAGCDSVVTLDLTINYSNTGGDVITACDSYTWLDGNTYTTSNNTATWTTTNAAGCDSIITLNLTINNSSSSTDVITACDSYTWLDGNNYTASNNIATYTIPNATGCDSIVTLDLTINSSNTGTDVITACDSYTWADGNTYTISNNTATYTATNADGCDSVVTLNLTIVPLPNNSVTQTGATLTADQGGASYEWLDCGSNLVPVGGSWQSFLPAFSGNYAVEVTLNGCIDTSDCFLIDYTSHLNNITNSTIIKIYPNPTSDILMISGLNKVSGVRGLEITSPKGDIVRRLEGTKEEINVSMLKSGIYFLNINHDKGVETIRFIKQ